MLEELLSRYPSLTACREDIAQASQMLIDCYRRGGKLLSTAHPGSGVGLLSVQTAAGRYHGEVTIETENQLFRVNILLNI